MSAFSKTPVISSNDSTARSLGTQAANAEREEKYRLLHSVKTLQIQNATARRKVQEVQLENQSLTDKYENKERECQALKKEAERRKEDYNTFKKIEAKWHEHLSLRNNQIRDLTYERDRLKELVGQKDLEGILAVEQKRSIQEQEIKTSQQQAANESKSIWLTRYQERLTQYAISVNQQKTKAKELSTRIAQEIQNLSQAHPLRDCLQMTEHELNQVESRLRKLPASSIERTEFEAGMNQLVEQRNFILKIIEDSERALQRQAQSLLDLSEDAALIPVPPPGPARVVQ